MSKDIGSGNHSSRRGPEKVKPETESLFVQMVKGLRPKLHANVKSAGWRSTTEFLEAVARGEVEIPNKG